MMRARFADPQTRAIGAIVAEGFLSRLSFGVVWVTVLFYGHYELGMGYAEIGVLLSVNTVIAIALKPFMGSLADRCGLKRTLVVAMVFRSAVTLVYLLAAGPLALYAARVIHGVSISMRDPAIGALIAECGGKKQIAQSFAWYQTAKSFAGNAAKAGGLALLFFTDSYSAVFLAAFVMSAAPLWVVIRHLHEPVRPLTVPAHAVVEMEKPEAPPHKLGAKVIAAFTGLGFLISATAYSVSSFFPILAKDYAGLNAGAISLIMGVVTFIPLTGPIFGWLADHVNPKVVLSFRSLANIGSSALYLAFPTFGGLAAGRILDDMGKAAFKPAWGAMAAHLSSFDRKNRARTMGYLSSGEDAGEVSGQLGAGLVLSLGGGIVALPALLIGRMALAGVTEIYTVVFAKKYLEEKVARQRGFVRRLPMPVRIAVAVAAGFAAGVGGQQIVSQSAQPSAAADATPAIAQPATSTQCTGNDTIDAIRRQTGGC